MDVKTVLTFLQLILAGMNIAIMLYAFKSFLSKPHDSLEKRVSALEIRQKDTELKLHQGNDRFREQSAMNEAIQETLLALIEFEIQYCTTEGKGISKELERAKEKLHNYLVRRRYEENRD